MILAIILCGGSEKTRVNNKKIAKPLIKNKSKTIYRVFDQFLSRIQI